jgi:hypothetical protein
MSILYLFHSDKSQKSETRHQDLPLRVSQDVIGEGGPLLVYSTNFEFLFCSPHALNLTCFQLILTCFNMILTCS